MARNKIQKIGFDTVEDFLEYLPEDESDIVRFLREIVLDCIPDCVERLSYNVPYYYRHSRICFIWPSSVPWGNVPQYGVQLGFVQGKLLSNQDYYLERGKRKQVYIKTFVSVDEIDVDRVKSLIYEAVEIDEEIMK